MAQKSTLMPAIVCPHVDYLESALAIYQIKGALTRNQAQTIRTMCARMLPATVELQQRTPKGVVYVYVSGRLVYEINVRAKAKQIFD